MNNTQQSSIKLASNIMLKAKYQANPWGYIPADLLPAYYADSRLQNALTPGQRFQFKKKLFYAEKIVDE